METPVTERRQDTFYLNDDLREQVELACDELNLMYRRKYGEPLEKNRHLRPLLLYLGAQQLQDFTPEEVKLLLDGVDVLDDAPGGLRDVDEGAENPH